MPKQFGDKDDLVSVTFELRKTYTVPVSRAIVMGNDELFGDYLEVQVETGLARHVKDDDLLVITDLDEVHFD
jgi:hypothetical protein